jgi:ABC-type Co2+ transport system permease subunit
MSTVSIVVTVVWAVAGFAILYKLATSRGRNPILWGLFGAVAFLIALIVILVAGKSDNYQPRAAS